MTLITSMSFSFCAYPIQVYEDTELPHIQYASSIVVPSSQGFGQQSVFHVDKKSECALVNQFYLTNKGMTPFDVTMVDSYVLTIGDKIISKYLPTVVDNLDILPLNILDNKLIYLKYCPNLTITVTFKSSIFLEDIVLSFTGYVTDCENIPSKIVQTVKTTQSIKFIMDTKCVARTPLAFNGYIDDVTIIFDKDVKCEEMLLHINHFDFWNPVIDPDRVTMILNHCYNLKTEKNTHWRPMGLDFNRIDLAELKIKVPIETIMPLTISIIAKGTATIIYRECQIEMI